MKWQEVRELFPDQFVLVSIINYHEEDNKKIVDEVAPIRIISEQDADKEAFQVKSWKYGVPYIKSRLCDSPPQRSINESET